MNLGLDTLTRRGSTAKPETTAQEDRARIAFLRRRRARRWRVLRRLLLVLTVLAVSAALVWMVFFSSVLAVRGAKVSGVSVLTEQQVLEQARVPVGTPLATADLDAVVARLEDLAPVDSVRVTRDWPHLVHIEVTERTAVAAVSWEGSWRGLDAAGVLFRSYPTKPADLPEISISASTSADALAESAVVVEALPAEILSRVASMRVGSIDDINLTLTDGSRINWGSADESADKAAVLEVLLDKPARVYDVTAPGRPTISQ